MRMCVCVCLSVRSFPIATALPPYRPLDRPTLSSSSPLSTSSTFSASYPERVSVLAWPASRIPFSVRHFHDVCR